MLSLGVRTKGAWLALVATAACSPFEGFEASTDALERDAASGTPLPVEPGECDSAAVPRPSVFNGGTGNIEFTAVIKTLDLGDSNDENGVPRYLSMGFDLDGTCTGAGGIMSCRPPPWAPITLDGPNGRDNSGATLAYQLHQNGRGSFADLLNYNTKIGLVSGALRVRHYNGSLVDNDVEVAWYGVTMYPDGEEEQAYPAWDGSDVWHVADAWIDAGAEDAEATLAPEYVDRHAYVTNGLLVARFPLLRGADVVEEGVFLSQAVITARPEREDGTWVLRDGTIAGRMNVDDTLNGLEGTLDAMGNRYCTDHPDYLPRKQRLCALADISFAGPDDGSTECDAVSYGWKFETVPAELSGVVSTDVIVEDPERAAVCPKEVRPADDVCANLVHIFGLPDPEW